MKHRGVAKYSNRCNVAEAKRRFQWPILLLSCAIGACLLPLASCSGAGPRQQPQSHDADEALLARPHILATVRNGSCSQHTLGALHRSAEWLAVRFGACRDGKSRFVVFDKSGRRLWSSDTSEAAKAFNTNGTGRVNPDQIGSQWVEQTV